jgi:hypothetical protein
MVKKQNKELILIFLLCILILVLIFDLFNSFLIIDEKELYTKVVVSDHAGFDLDNTILAFGMTQPGKSISRSIYLENNFDFPVNVNLRVEGEISDFLIIPENDFIIISKEKKKLNFVVIPKKDTPFGEYDGIIKIIFKK